MTAGTSIAAAVLLAGSLLLPAPVAGAAGEPVSPEWAQSWQDDLRYFARELPRVHPAPFGELTREQFDRRIDELIAAAPERSHSELVVGLAEIVAALGDGHSRVTLPLSDDAGFFLGHSKTAPPEVPGLLFHPLPIRLQRLADGLFVRAVDAAHPEAAGARVLAIGGKSVAEAEAAVAPVVHRDNRYQLADRLPDYLVLPEVLAATGVIESAGPVDLTLQPPGGEPFLLRLAPAAGDGSTPELIDSLTVTGVPLPRYLRAVDRNFWLEYLPEDRTVYVQYNTIQDADDETVAAFAERLSDLVERNPVDRLVIDLRHNRGGNNNLNLPLLHALIASPKLQRPGSLFAIIGPATFSAAMMFAVDLERHTPVIFVGEPTGAAPNHYGDSRKLRLPRTSLTVRISTLEWQYSDPRDERDAIDPHLPVAATSADYLAGRDPALAAILEPGPAAPEGAWDRDSWADRWRGRLTYLETYDVSLSLERDGDAAGGWSGHLDSPDLGVTEAELSDLVVGGGRGDELTFVLVDSDGSYTFTARREGDRLYGAMRLGSQEVPFVLVADRRGVPAPAR